MPFPGPEGLFYKMGMGPSPKKALRAPSWPVPPTAFWGATAGGPALSHTLPGPGGSAGRPHPSVAPGQPAGSSPPAWSRAGGRGRGRPAGRPGGRAAGDSAETGRDKAAARGRPLPGRLDDRSRPQTSGGGRGGWGGGAPLLGLTPEVRDGAALPPHCQQAFLGGGERGVLGSRERCQWGAGQGWRGWAPSVLGASPSRRDGASLVTGTY